MHKAEIPFKSSEKLTASQEGNSRPAATWAPGINISTWKQATCCTTQNYLEPTCKHVCIASFGQRPSKEMISRLQQSVKVPERCFVFQDSLYMTVRQALFV